MEALKPNLSQDAEWVPTLISVPAQCDAALPPCPVYPSLDDGVGHIGLNQIDADTAID